MGNIRGFFDRNGHLNDHFTALAADYLNDSGKNILPEEVLLHIETCGKCRDKILDIFSTSIYRDTDRGNRGKIPELPGDKKKEEKSFRRYYRRSAAVFFLLAFFSAIYVFIVKNSSSLLNTSGANEIKPVHKILTGAPEIQKKLTRPEKRESKKINRQIGRAHV